MAKAYENYLKKFNFKSYNYEGEYSHIMAMKDACPIEYKQYVDKFFFDEDDSNFFDMKNIDMKFSDLYSNVVDGKIISEVLKFIEENKKYFGKKILDLGCDNGLITCFIAYLFPNREVVGIDYSKKAIDICNKRAQKLKLKNIKFYEATTSNMKYDTIFTSRVVNFNMKKELKNKTTPKFENMFERFDRTICEYGDFINNLNEILNKDGHIIQFERFISPTDCAKFLYTYRYYNYSCIMFDAKTIYEGGVKKNFIFSIMQNNTSKLISPKMCFDISNQLLKIDAIRMSDDAKIFTSRYMQLLDGSKLETYNVYLNDEYKGNIVLTLYNNYVSSIIDLDSTIQVISGFADYSYGQAHRVLTIKFSL